ncbi:MAG: response regulator [Polyangiaceae bacterium]
MDNDTRDVAARQSAPTREILVVEDDEDLRDILVATLRREGYEATLAGDGHRALQVLALRRDDPPAAIVLDLMMPRMGGRAFLDAYELSGLPMVPVIVLSSAPESMPRADERRVVSYMRKPVDLARLVESLALWAS